MCIYIYITSHVNAISEVYDTVAVFGTWDPNISILEAITVEPEPSTRTVSFLRPRSSSDPDGHNSIPRLLQQNQRPQPLG